MVTKSNRPSCFMFGAINDFETDDVFWWRELSSIFGVDWANFINSNFVHMHNCTYRSHCYQILGKEMAGERWNNGQFRRRHYSWSVRDTSNYDGRSIQHNVLIYICVIPHSSTVSRKGLCRILIRPPWDGAGETCFGKSMQVSSSHYLVLTRLPWRRCYLQSNLGLHFLLFPMLIWKNTHLSSQSKISSWECGLNHLKKSPMRRDLILYLFSAPNSLYRLVEIKIKRQSCVRNSSYLFYQ